MTTDNGITTERSVEHGSFSIEHRYAAPPERVFAAWSIESEKDRWFGAGDDFLASTDAYSLDFRVGGHERLAGTMPGGRAFSYDAIYQDIVEDRRIVMSYDVCVDGRRNSVSLMTVELTPVLAGTRLLLTEQGAFLDGLDSNVQREEGARDSLDKLASYLRAQG
jgi:uncharacterized protein YndB with AHSA1/START domain